MTDQIHESRNDTLARITVQCRKVVDLNIGVAFGQVNGNAFDKVSEVECRGFRVPCYKLDRLTRNTIQTISDFRSRYGMKRSTSSQIVNKNVRLNG